LVDTAHMISNPKLNAKAKVHMNVSSFSTSHEEQRLFITFMLRQSILHKNTSFSVSLKHYFLQNIDRTTNTRKINTSI
jgi:hypothetical protein